MSETKEPKKTVDEELDANGAASAMATLKAMAICMAMTVIAGFAFGALFAMK